MSLTEDEQGIIGAGFMSLQGHLAAHRAVLVMLVLQASNSNRVRDAFLNSLERQKQEIQTSLDNAENNADRHYYDGIMEEFQRTIDDVKQLDIDALQSGKSSAEIIHFPTGKDAA